MKTFLMIKNILCHLTRKSTKGVNNINALTDLLQYITYFEYEKLIAFDINHRYIFIDVSLWNKISRKPKFTMRFLYGLLSALNVRLGWYELVPQRETDVTLVFITTTLENKDIPLYTYNNLPSPKKGAFESFLFQGKPVAQFAYINKHILNFCLYDPILNETAER